MSEFVIPQQEAITSVTESAPAKYEARHRGPSRREQVVQGIAEFITRRVELSPEANFDSQVTGIPDYVSSRYGEPVLAHAEPATTDYPR